MNNTEVSFNNSAKQEPTTQDSGESGGFGIYIGGSVGGAVGLIILLCIIFCCCCG
jgi:hypothetical protein